MSFDSLTEFVAVQPLCGYITGSLISGIVLETSGSTNKVNENRKL